MRTIETTVYTYDELSPDAQAKARDWFREAYASDNDVEHVYDDAANVAELMGFDIRQRRVTLMDKTHTYKPSIYYSGFWSQGDGACCEGTWKAKNVQPGEVAEYAPKDEDLQTIAREFERIALLCPHGSFSVRHSGQYYHSGCTDFEFDLALSEFSDGIERSEVEWAPIDARANQLESDLKDNARRFMDWIYEQLEKEYDYQNSDEVVAENIIANEYEFTAEGVRA